MSELTITGVCQEIAQKPGSEWVEFHIDGGGQWPVRLSTKLQPLIELGKAAGGQLATWTYKEVESDRINEKSGKPYINRYLSSVEVGGAAAAPSSVATPDAAAQAETSQPRAIVGSEKDRLIVRQTCIKAAADLHSADTDPAVVMETAAKFERWVALGILDEIPF